ncbi:MAG: type IV toxin-antitoxin system AbiEi family antitoxin [Bacteroidota bacterium]
MIADLKHTTDFIKEYRSNGRYAFTIDDVISATQKPLKNIRKDIDRLREKGLIRNIRKGFYIIIPDEYSKMGGIPVEFYVDDLMKYLTRQYYVGLFSAAMFHGAAHQQPQEFFIISESPKTRNIKNRNIIINFSEKKHFPQAGIETRKTDTGYFNISGKELTFLDLIYFENLMGGFSRITTILKELSEDIKPAAMKKVIDNDFPASVFQRAGYMAEQILHNKKLASIFEKKLASLNFQPAYLKASGTKVGVKDDKWNLFINTKIETDI